MTPPPVILDGLLDGSGMHTRSPFPSCLACPLILYPPSKHSPSLVGGIKGWGARCGHSHIKDGQDPEVRKDHLMSPEQSQERAKTLVTV